MKFSMKSSFQWSILISTITFIIAASLSVLATWLMADLTWALGIMVVFIFIFVGIVFDVIGLATASASEVPFHSMASKKVNGARQALLIIRNADRVSNFCNDVVGDICGVMSGTASAMVVARIIMDWESLTEWWKPAVGVVAAGLVSAFTVGGKALGKSFAIYHSVEIVLRVGKLLHVMERMMSNKSNQDSKAQAEKRGGKRDS